MNRLLAAELRALGGKVAALGVGAFAFLFAVAATYQAFGGKAMPAKLFGGRPPSGIAAFSGSRSGDLFSPKHYLAFGFNHPLFLVLTLAVAVSLGARSVAGDVETGRAELVYSRPVARRKILVSHIAVWLAAQLAVIAAAVAGALLGSRISPDLRSAGAGRVVWVAAQYVGVAAFVAGLSFAVSALTRTRSAAMGITVGITALAYLVNFVSVLWQPIAWARWLSPFGYYDPMAAATAGVGLARLTALVGAAAALFAVAVAALERRDLV